MNAIYYDLLVYSILSTAVFMFWLRNQKLEEDVLHSRNRVAQLNHEYADAKVEAMRHYDTMLSKLREDKAYHSNRADVAETKFKMLTATIEELKSRIK